MYKTCADHFLTIRFSSPQLGETKILKRGNFQLLFNIRTIKMSVPKITLNNGLEMPMLGMGTWHHGPKHEIQDALR